MSASAKNKPSPMTSALMKLWHSLMFFSTVTLTFDVWVLKDAASLPYVVLGVIGLCLPSAVGIIRSITHYFDVRREHAEFKRNLELKRVREARIRTREREREMREQEELYALREAAEAESLRNKYSNVNIAAFRPK